jgi:hypothetical protein
MGCLVGAEIGTQLITVGATLGGVLLTLASTAYNERRRAQDARELESMRLASEQAVWLREQRVRAYAGLSSAGEDALQFIRWELPTVIQPGRGRDGQQTESRWNELRTALRMGYNQVALFGGESARAAGLQLWRTARSGGNDFLRALDPGVLTDAARAGLSERLRTVASELGTAGDRFLDTCRADLQRQHDQLTNIEQKMGD